MITLIKASVKQKGKLKRDEVCRSFLYLAWHTNGAVYAALRRRRSTFALPPIHRQVRVLYSSIYLVHPSRGEEIEGTKNKDSDMRSRASEGL